MLFCMSRGESEYNLQLAFDINTDRHTQWFYFRMKNLRRGRPYKLNMQNLMKTEAVYNLGMQPLAYSEVDTRGCLRRSHSARSQQGAPQTSTPYPTASRSIVQQRLFTTSHVSRVVKGEGGAR